LVYEDVGFISAFWSACKEHLNSAGHSEHSRHSDSNLRLPLPPEGEQRQITAHLDSILPAFDQLATESQRAIDLLRERRTALVSAAVTGQIDVRNVEMKGDQIQPVSEEAQKLCG
jgi:type I restriction enzyme S subunit